ncbi:MAG: ABC transporter ATP-binding protein [Anaeroplasmataceae bacterium]
MNLKCENLKYEIDELEIIKGISLDIENKEFHTILGPNGCGKSTLLKMIYKILKPNQGAIYLDLKNIDDISIKNMAKNMAVVSQFNSLNFDSKVIDIVILGRTPHLKAFSNENDADYKIAYDALNLVGMYDKRYQSYSSLSGGEKQRVILARAITQQPSILLLDEPLNHLDIKYQLEILKIVSKLNITVLAVLHDLSLASMFSDYIYLMKNGVIKYKGTPLDVINKETIKDIYDVDTKIYKDKERIIISYV